MKQLIEENRAYAKLLQQKNSQEIEPTVIILCLCDHVELSYERVSLKKYLFRYDRQDFKEKIFETYEKMKATKL